MGEWLIYGSNGTQKATVKKLEYSGEFMGETSVTCDIYSPSPISFSIGDYLVYRGERFTIDYDATRLKQSRNNTYGKGYTYENMRFLSYVGELKKCEFLDFVPSDNLIHFSQLPDFSFYAETVKDLADRLQANLDRIYTGSKAWSVQVVQGFEGKENINVSVSKATCFDALRMAYDQFEATFIIRGRTITIGTAGNELETDFKYGKGNGLKTIERSVDESDSLVTRLRAYGNTTNLPANYYKNIGMRVYAPIYEIYHVSTTGCDIHFVPKLKNACFNDKNGQYNYWVTVSLDETLWLKAVASPNNHLSSTAYSVVTVGLYGSNTQAQITQFLNQLQSGTYDNLYFKQGINVGAWPVEYREYAENVPNLMAIDRLMLPGFPGLTTDPYIDASNISTLGVREKSVYFDGSDPDTPDIHPTLEGMTAAELRAAGYTIDLDAGDNGNLDEIAADATETDGSPITADGAFEGVDEVPGFKVSIKDIGFDINDYLSTETATLVMKTGMCGGREFTIVKVEKVGNKYVLECQRTEDVSHYFPYNPYLIKAGDKFVLTNIEMPKAYIDAASQRLLVAAQAYIAKYSAPQWVYAIKMDDIWMQRQRDNSVSEASSYYWNIKEGDVMNVTDSDLGVDIAEVIDRLTIREGFGPIPEFEVVLRKEKPQGTIGVLQNRIRQLELRNAEQVDIIRRQQNYLTFIFGDTLADVMSQLDKKAETWYQASDPSSAWTTDEAKSEHVGDLWMDTSANGGKKTYIYRYTPGENPEYHWDEQFVPDEVFDEIDGKAEIFVQKPTSYHERDMWIIENGISSSDLPAGCVAGDIVISSTDSTSFNKAHWSKKDRYTDDSSLNAFISGTYADDLQDIQNQIDGKAETWYQNTDPSTAWTTTALKNQHKGDIWHNSSNTTINGVKAGQDAIWNGTAWVVDETVPQAIYDEIDGKCAIYVSWGAWGDDLQEKDLFIPSANTTQGGVTYKANKVYRCTNKSTPTFQEIAYTDDAALNAFLNGYTGTLTGIRNDISNAQTTANNANTAAAAAQATADALDYLKQAYSADNTLIDHGLILSTIVALRDSSNNVWSGISGAYDSTKLGNGIAAWYGGGMIDKEVSDVANAAKSLFRFDGSGYVASGNLSWDKNGNVTIQGYSINATTLQVGGSNVATQAMLDNFVSKAFFNRLFTAYDANGNAIVPNNTTTAINNLKIMVGAWTEQYLSALGLNSEGGGGGTGDVSHIKIGTNPDVFLDPDEDGIIDMSSYAANWNDAYQKRHTHSNKSVLDGITSTKVSHWDAVYGVVPSAAYETGNSLADKNFVNSSISTSTATFRGTNTTATTESAFLTWANGLTHDLNDYVFWSTKDSAGNTIYKRYKYDGSQWVFEYDLNNSSFTSDQWSAINSGITSTHVTKLNGIASGAQVNVIESVKVNGTALSVTSKAVDITAVPLTIITGADDLKAIEGISGTGFLKRTGNNTWALDTTVVLNTRKVSTGNGLQGGGDLSADRTISILLPANSGLSVASTGLKLDIVNNLTTSSEYRAISAKQAKKIWDLLNQMFTLEGAGTDASPYVIKANYGLYTNQFLSALGQNTQGGGGTTDLNAVWGSLTTNQDEYANEKIDAHHIPIGNTLEIISGTGLIQQKSGVIAIPDVYTKVTVDTYGRVTQGGDLLADDIPTLSMSKISGLSTALGNVYTKTESDGKYVTALGTSGNYLTYTKNGNANSITVPYATTTNSLKNLGRKASANLTHVIDGGVQHFKAASAMTEGKPANDGHILHFHWDNTGAWDSQLFLSDDPTKPYLQYRAKNGDSGVWGSWITALDTNNTYVTNGKGYINGTEITTISGNAATATKLGTTTVGSSVRPIYLNSGVPTQVSSVESTLISEPSYVSGGITPTTYPLVNTVRTNKLVLLPAEQVIIEKTTDGGATWVDYGASNAQKEGLFTGSFNSVYITIPKINGEKSKLCGIRITITGMKYNVPSGTPETQKYNYWNSNYYSSTERYCSIESLYFWVACPYDRIRTAVYVSTGANPNTWIRADKGYSYLSGNTGGNIVFTDQNITGTFGGYAGQTGNKWNYRFEFFTDGLNGADLGQTTTSAYQYISRIQGFGRNGWVSPNNLFSHDHIYTWDENQVAIFPYTIRPYSNNNGNLGTAPQRWANVYATAIDASTGSFSSNVSIDGTITNKYLAIAESWTDTWSDGTHTHPWYGIDGRWNNTGVYSTTISDYYGLTLKTGGGNISMKQDGNVGIGTFDPSYKLDVNGTARLNSTTYIGGSLNISTNNANVNVYDTNGNAVNALKLDTSNTLRIGGGSMLTNGYNSVLYGRAIYLYTGTNSSTPAVAVNAYGRVAISNDLEVANGITLTTTKKITFGTGNDAPYIELDSNGYFHFSAGLYSDSFVSALGANDQGGGSSGFDEEQMWQALGSDPVSAKKIDNSHLNIAAWAKAANKPSYTWSEIQNKPSWIGSSKPTYTFSEITSKPTTLSGYGVLDDANGKYYALYGGTDLNPSSTNAVDLNTITTVGSYYCGGDSRSQYVTNKPTGTNHSFRMWVSCTLGVGTSYIRQRFQFYTSTEIYERHSNNGGSYWFDWVKVQDNLSNYASASYFTNGVANKAYHVERIAIISTTDFPTVGESKTELARLVAQQGAGIGDNITISGSVVGNWSDDSAATYATSAYSMIKIGGGYSGSTYGQWLLSSYNLTSVGVVGRNSNAWSDIKWLAWTDGTNASGTWGIGITGNAGSATKLQTPKTIWGQSFDGTANVDGNLTINVANKSIIYKDPRVKAGGGGWYDPIIRVQDASGTEHISLGWFGNNETPHSLFFGFGTYGSYKGIVITSSGNVGIGTTSAFSSDYTYKLYVNGTLGVAGATTLSSTLGVTGAATFNSTLSVAGLLSANGNVKTTKLYLYKPNSDDTNAVYLTYDSTNSGVHIVGAGLYSDSYVSALGANSQGGGGSTFDEEQMWVALGTTVDTKIIDSTHIPNLSWNKITSNKPTTLSGYGILDAYTKTQADAKYATISSLSDYLPLSGGTITGALTISAVNDSKIILNNTDSDTNYSWISFRQNGTEYGKLGTHLNETLLRWNSNVILHTGNSYVTNGKGYINGTEITTISGNAATASKLGTSTVGSSTMPIFLNAGTPTQITSFPEAYLSWGGKDISGGNTPLDAALISNLGANRFAFIPAECTTIEYSTDGGATWVDYGVTDAQKVSFFAAPLGTYLYLGKHNVAGSGSANDKLRITVDTYSNGNKVYSVINKFACYMSTNGAANCRWTMQVRKTSDILNNVDTWTNVFTDVPISGWSGINIANHTVSLGSNNPTSSANTQYRQFRFIFSQGDTNANYYSSCIIYVSAYGGVGWSTPSKMASYGSIYSYDANQCAFFPADIIPQNNNTQYLGNSNYRWKTVYSTALDLNGAITGATTGTFSSDVSIGGTLSVTGSTTLGNVVYMPNGKAIYWKDSLNRNLKTLELSLSNDLNLGLGTAEAGYDTLVSGNNIYFRYGTARAYGMHLDSNGNVSIINSLTIGSNLTTGRVIYMPNNGEIYIKDTNNDYKSILNFNNTNDFLIGYGTGGSGYNTYIDGNAIRLRYGTSHFTGFVLTSAGNVGINTTSPSFKLHVNGTLGVESNVSVGGTLGVTGATTLTGLLTANGGIIVPSGKTIKIGDATLSWDSTNQMLKVDKGFYSEGAVSALGSNSEGGGSGAGLEDVWDSLTNQQGTVITDNTKIAIAHIPDTSSTYGYLKASALSGYATQAWVNQQGFLTTHQTLYTLSIYGGTTKVLDFKPNANASIYIKAGGDISLTNDTTNKYITLSYTHPTNGANTTISAASGKVLSAITVNSLGHVTSVSSKTLAFADMPSLYIGTTAVQSTSATQNLTGINVVAKNLTDTWSDGTNAHPWYGYDSRYANTGVYSTTISDYYGLTLRTMSGHISITSGGNVGVGTTEPTKKLDVAGNFRVLNNSSDLVIARLLHNSANPYGLMVKAYNSGAFHLQVQREADNSEVFPLLLNPNDGNVGIGTTSPSYKLHVAGTFYASGNSSIGGTLGVTGATTLSSTLGVTGNTTLSGTLGVTKATTLSSSLSVASGITLTTTKKIYFGDTSHYIELTSTGFHFSHGIYSDSFISALGANSSGGSSTFDEEAMWTALGTTSSAQVIASSHIPNLAASKITSGTFAAARIPNLSWTKITSDKPTTLSGYGITDAFTQTQSFDKFYSLYDGKAIEASSSNAVDLDNLTTSGSYYCETNTASGYVTNKPANRDIAFRIWVSKPTGTTNGYVRQRFQFYDQVAVYERIDTNLSSVSWGNWYKVQDALNDYLPLSGGQMTGVLTWKNSTALSGVTSTSYVLCIDGFADGGATHYISTSNLTVGNATNATNATSATTASKLSTVSKTAWGQTYWTSSGVPTNISGSLSDVTNITMSGNIFLNNNQYIYTKDSGGTNRPVFYMTTNDNLYIGYGATAAGGATYVAGTSVELRYGSSRTTGLTLDSNGDVTVKGKVCVGTGGADSYLASDAADNIYLRNSSGAVLVCDGKVIRRSTSVSDVTLGSSSYPWGGVYSTTGTFNSNVSVGGTLDVTGAVTMSSNLTVTGRVRPIGNIVMGTSSNSMNADSGQIHFRTSYMTDFTKHCSPYIQAIGGSSYGRKRLSVFQNNGTSSDYNVAYSEVFTILANGRVGIGNTTPGALLGVSGDILASGEITASSDERKKNIISDTKFNVRDIASARSILYEWNDGRDKDNEKKIHGGSIAQDWLGKADSFLSQDNDGWYSINYGALALCSAITIAREVLKHSDEIDRLKQEVSYLKAKVAELEERRIA